MCAGGAIFDVTQRRHGGRHGLSTREHDAASRYTRGVGGRGAAATDNDAGACSVPVAYAERGKGSAVLECFLNFREKCSFV